VKMRKSFKWTGIILSLLIGLIVVAAVSLYTSTSLKITKQYSIQPEAVTIPTDAASIERGKHLATVICMECHGPDLGGKVVFSDPALGLINAANLTPGKGGAGKEFKDADWVRAIRHGVDDQGRALVIMPSRGFYYLSDADLGAEIAYLKTLSPVDKEWADPSLTPIARILAALGAFGEPFAAEAISHSAPRPAAPPPGATADYGGYLVNVLDCRTCHGAQLSGGKDPDPKAPPAPNLTPGGDLANWTQADFDKAMHTGVIPNGRTLKSFMPWKTYGQMTDDELKAIYLYLGSLPTVESKP
jgi:mono/diheme cytochrome c family protein